MIYYSISSSLIYEENRNAGCWSSIQNGVDLDGSPIPQKMLDLYNRIMDEEKKRKRSGVKKSMRNRCVKTGSKHFDKETLNQLLIDSGWEGLKEKEIIFFYN